MPDLLNFSVFSFSVVTSQSGWHQCTLVPKESMTELDMHAYVSNLFCGDAVQATRMCMALMLMLEAPFYHVKQTQLIHEA